ncbi:MAG: ATP-binding protein [Myxococcota bacterium]|jgi:nitrogen fixation/metabolism regulation signal transduction histidine kinase|nr:ATP-binding protein [Myxococcota bacterium]
MSRFSVKIYAVLLIMGAVPLLASALLISEVLTFNKDLQDEALETLNDVALFHRAWAQAEGERIKLLGQLLRSAPELNTFTADSEPSRRRAKAFLEKQIGLYPVLYRAELVDREGKVLVDVQPTGQPRLDQVKVRTRTWALGAPAPEPSLTTHSAPRTGTALRLPDTFPGDEGNANADYSLRLTFGIERALSDRYDALGERRQLHRGLSALAEEEEGSLSSVYRNFYYIMLALVIVLTIAFALGITIPLGRRVGRLAQATERVAKGDLTIELPISGGDELSRLSKQFNSMVVDLREARRTHAYVERMRAWQEVARRLAHEIKNPLTPLLLAIQQLDKTFDKYREQPERYRQVVDDVVEIVTEEVQTLQKLVKDFSEFARLPAPDPQPKDVRAFIRHTLQSNPQFDERAQIELLEGEPLHAALDPNLMRRVVVNIVHNAIEAVEGAGGKAQLLIAVRKHEDMVRAVFQDNGPGVSAEQEEKVFEPYYTTKATGTGLGLSIVHKIMLDHGGAARLFNRKDGETGAEVWLDLPLLSASKLEELEHKKASADDAQNEESLG